jgi:hypothetical protein
VDGVLTPALDPCLLREIQAGQSREPRGSTAHVRGDEDGRAPRRKGDRYVVDGRALTGAGLVAGDPVARQAGAEAVLARLARAQPPAEGRRDCERQRTGRSVSFRRKGRLSRLSASAAPIWGNGRDAAIRCNRVVSLCPKRPHRLFTDGQVRSNNAISRQILAQSG